MNNYNLLDNIIFHPNTILAYKNPIIVVEFNQKDHSETVINDIKNCRELDVLYDILAQNNIDTKKLALTYYINVDAYALINQIPQINKFTPVTQFTPILNNEKLKYFNSNACKGLFVDLSIYSEESINGLNQKGLKRLLFLASKKITEKEFNITFNKDIIEKNTTEKSDNNNNNNNQYLTQFVHILNLIGIRIITDDLLDELVRAISDLPNKIREKIHEVLKNIIIQLCTGINAGICNQISDSDALALIIRVINFANKTTKYHNYDTLIITWDSLNINNKIFLELFKNVFKILIKLNQNIVNVVIKLVMSKIIEDDMLLQEFITEYLNKSPQNCHDEVYKCLINKKCQVQNIKIIENLIEFVDTMLTKKCVIRNSFTVSNKNKYKEIFRNYYYSQNDSKEVFFSLLSYDKFKRVNLFIKKELIKIYGLKENKEEYLNLLLNLNGVNGSFEQEIINVIGLNNCDLSFKECIKFENHDIILPGIQNNLTLELLICFLCEMYTKRGLKYCETCLEKSIDYYFTNLKKYDTCQINFLKLAELVQKYHYDYCISSRFVKLIKNIHELMCHFNQDFIDTLLNILEPTHMHSQFNEIIKSISNIPSIRATIMTYRKEKETFLQLLVKMIFNAKIYTIKEKIMYVNDIVPWYLNNYGTEDNTMIGNYVFKCLIEDFCTYAYSTDCIYNTFYGYVNDLGLLIKPKILINDSYVEISAKNYVEMYIKHCSEKQDCDPFYKKLLKSTSMQDYVERKCLIGSSNPVIHVNLRRPTFKEDWIGMYLIVTGCVLTYLFLKR